MSSPWTTNCGEHVTYLHLAHPSHHPARDERHSIVHRVSHCAGRLGEQKKDELGELRREGGTDVSLQEERSTGRRDSSSGHRRLQ